MRIVSGKFSHLLISLLLAAPPASADTTVTVMSFCLVLLLASVGYLITGSMFGAGAGVAMGLFLPTIFIKHLREKRLKKLNDQLVGGIQTLSSGVRAGLNLVQALELVARDSPSPIRQEFAHLVR